MRRDDWLVHQLPVGMIERDPTEPPRTDGHQDSFLASFVRIFQTVADSTLHQVDTLPHMFDPGVAPLPMVRAMGAWIGVGSIDSSLAPEVQRRLVRSYSTLLAWRGTRRGLRLLLRVLTGYPATVEDTGGVYRAGDEPGVVAPHVHIRVKAVPSWMHEDDLVTIVASELPASVTFVLEVGDRTIWPDPDPIWQLDLADEESA